MFRDDEISFIIEKYGEVAVLEAVAGQLSDLLHGVQRHSPAERRRIKSALTIIREITREGARCA